MLVSSGSLERFDPIQVNAFSMVFCKSTLSCNKRKRIFLVVYIQYIEIFNVFNIENGHSRSKSLCCQCFIEKRSNYFIGHQIQMQCLARMFYF